MNNIIKNVFIILSLVLLSGCATTEYRVEYKTKVIMPGDDLLVDCNKAEPPNKKEYISSTLQDREKALFEYSRLQTKNIQTCNARWKSLRDLKIKTIKELSDAEVVTAE